MAQTIHAFDAEEPIYNGLSAHSKCGQILPFFDTKTGRRASDVIGSDNHVITCLDCKKGKVKDGASI